MKRRYVKLQRVSFLNANLNYPFKYLAPAAPNSLLFPKHSFEFRVKLEFFHCDKSSVCCFCSKIDYKNYIYYTDLF